MHGPGSIHTSADVLLFRFMVGIGCGIVVVVVPNYLSEIAPPDRRGSVGVLNQLGIVTGIFIGQAVSISLATPSLWRFVPIVSASVAAAQGVLSAKMVESPVWLAGQAGADDVRADESECKLASLTSGARNTADPVLRNSIPPVGGRYAPYRRGEHRVYCINEQGTSENYSWRTHLVLDAERASDRTHHADLSADLR